MISSVGGPERVVPPTSSDEASRILRSTTVLTLVALLAVGTSFLWDIAIAARFGIGGRSDAFYLAYTLPSAITSLVYLCCYSVLVPTVARGLGRGEDEAAWRLFSIVANVILVLTLVAGLGCAAGSYWLVRALAPGFDGQTLGLATEMSAILFATLVIGVAFEVLRAGLYACNRVVGPTALTVLGNLIIVASVVAAGPQLGVRSAALGVVAAKACQLALIAPLLFRVPNFRYHWSLQWQESSVIGTLRAFLSPLSGLGARRLVLVVERILASTLPAGSITALSYGAKLGTVVGNFFYTSLTTALLPKLAVHIDRQDLARVRENLLAGVKLVTFISVPGVVLLVLLREPLVSVLFQRGQVRPEAVSLTATVLAIYAISLLPMGHFRILQNYFFAAQATTTAMALFGLTAVVNLALLLVFVRILDVQGIAVAYVVSLVVVMIAGYALVWSRAGGWPWRDISAFGGRAAVAGLFCAATVIAVERSWPWDVRLTSGVWSNATYLAVAGGLGALAYLAPSLVAQREEVGHTLALVRRRLGGTNGRRTTRPGPIEAATAGERSDAVL